MVYHPAAKRSACASTPPYIHRMPSKSDSRGDRQLQLNFSEAAYQDLHCRAHVYGETPGEIISRGLGLMKLFNDTRHAGGRVLMQRPDGELFEVLPR